MSQFIDRRLNSKHKSAVNRQRFLQRFKEQIKKAVTEAANKRSITDIDRGEKIRVPSKDINEPRLRHGTGGQWESVHAGNKDFITGDHIKRVSDEASEKSSQASDTGSGWDEFAFDISREEFLALFFDDMALPNLIKTQITALPSYKLIRAGFTQQGTPTNISILRSLKMAHSRRMALGGAYKEQLRLAEKELANELQINPENENSKEVQELKRKIASLKQYIEKIPFIDPFDLRYRNRIQQPQLNTQAVMFCLMDVSGSMDEKKKEIAKRFFILLYLFLTRNYEKIELVFIRHHTTAKAVDEQEFFYSRETGGTVVSSALELMYEIVRKHYPTTDWNIYAAQASDGDNWSADSPYCQEILSKNLLPLMQYFAYVEIMPRYHQSLWEAYTLLKEHFSNFAMQTINDLTDIYPVLRELFQKNSARE